MSLVENIKSMKNVNVGDKTMVLMFAQALSDAIVMPNEMIPDEFHNRRGWETGNLRKSDANVYGPTITQINKKWTKLYGKKEERKTRQQEKDTRLSAYIAEYAATGKFNYQPDENKLYRNETTFCDLMGLIEVDDLLE